MATLGDSTTELREDIPLNRNAKRSKCFIFDEDCIGGSKFVNISFGVISAGITVALLAQIYYGDYQVVPHGSVATDSRECSEIGTSVLKDGGNAVDAAVASTFCLAVVKPHLTGLDAQGEILIYNHRLRLTPDYIDFSNIERKLPQLPRLVLGLAYIHNQYGLLSWQSVVQRAADLARKGFLVSKTLSMAIAKAQVKHLFGPLEAGHIAHLETLAETLDAIANIPEEALQEELNLINLPEQLQAMRFTFDKYNIYVPGAPSAGPALLANLQHVGEENFTLKDVGKPNYVSTLAYIIGTNHYNFNVSSEFYNGTSSNVAVIDMNEQYVSLITGMYAPFGSKEMTPSGFLLDLPLNKLCTRIPFIITNKDYICGRRLVLGANDIELATQVITSLLVGGGNATVGIEAPRFGFVNFDSIGLEESHTPLYNDDVVQHLETAFHLIPLKEPYDSCNIVEKVGDDLNSHSDSREGGISSRF